MRLPANPSDPTQEERERHNKTHLPHRSWCAVCVQARAREDKHYKAVNAERELGLPRVSLDYGQLEDTVEGEAGVKVTYKKRFVVGRDRWSRFTFAHLVKCKGLGDDTVVKKLTKSVDKLGYRKMVLKTDGEPALVAVQAAVAKNRDQDTLCENPPAHDHQANGDAERAVGELKAQMGAVKIGLEARIQKEFDARWPIIEWMVSHAANLINCFLMGSDGKTAHYRVHHKFFKGVVMEMGEQIWARPVRENSWTIKNKNPKLKLSLKSSWIEATWVGFDDSTHEHLVVVPGTMGPALRVRTVRTRPPSERWSAKAIEEIRATPDVPNPRDESQRHIGTERNTKGMEVGAKPDNGVTMQDTEKAKDVRDFRITDAHLEEFGHTPGCAGCEAKRHGAARRMHNRTCRMRMESEIKKKRPEDPWLQRRDDRHVAWAEEYDRAEASRRKVIDPSYAYLGVPQEPEQQTETPRVELAAPSTSNEADAPPPMHESDSDDDMPVDLEYAASSDEEDADATARHPPEKNQRLFSLQCKTAGLQDRRPEGVQQARDPIH